MINMLDGTKFWQDHEGPCPIIPKLAFLSPLAPAACHDPTGCRRASASWPHWAGSEALQGKQT